MVRFGELATPVGRIVVLSDGAAVTRVGWRLRPATDAASGVDDVLDAALAQLAEYFAGARHRFDVPFDLGRQSEGTRAVLTPLYETVGSGESITYGELAERSGCGIPARGIGALMGANPIPIIVPCHRVVAGGGLGGYSGGDPGQGRATKRRLLEFEGALPAALF